jgi:hypothetical protein
MSVPSTLPEWDTNNTHVTPTTAGHKTDGWVSNEIPSSSEMGYWMNLVYLWIAWLNSIRVKRAFFPKLVDVPGVSTGWAMFGDITTLNHHLSWSSSAAASMTVHLSEYLREGETLDKVHVLVSGDGAVDITATLYLQDLGAVWGSPSTLVATATATDAPGNAITTLSLTGLNSLANSNRAHVLRVTANAANARVYLMKVETL